MTNDNTYTTEPKWYVFSAWGAETIYGQFDNDEYAEEYRQILDEGAGTDIYNFYDLENKHFKQIAEDKVLKKGSVDSYYLYNYLCERDEDDNTTDVLTPAWYVFSADREETIYGWFDTDKDAKKYEETLNKDAGADLYSFYKLESDDDFRKIAEEEFLNEVCVMNCDYLPIYKRERAAAAEAYSYE